MEPAHYDSQSAALPDNVSELVNRCLAGQESAMVALVNRFQDRVFSLCYRMLGHRQDAEDMTQESMARALRSLRNWDQEREFMPWLLAIAGNRCRTLLSARSRRPATSELLEQFADPAPEANRARVLAEEVQLALGKIRAEYRQAFELFHERELSYAQIAERMQVPLGTIKTWVHRARRELVEHLRARGAVEELRHEMHGL